MPVAAPTDDYWTITVVTGHAPAPVVFVNAEVHGAEYPSIQTMIQLSHALDPERLRGTVVLLPGVSLPGFWERSTFVCPVDGKNPGHVWTPYTHSALEQSGRRREGPCRSGWLGNPRGAASNRRSQ